MGSAGEYIWSVWVGFCCGVFLGLRKVIGDERENDEWNSRDE